jgi:hypothetical protein
LIVTPVIFFSLRARQLKKQGVAGTSDECSDETDARALVEDGESRSGVEKESGTHE